MTFNSVRYVFSALILVTGLLTASLSFASSITGDDFTVEVSEELVPFARSESGVAGSAGVDVGVYPGNAQFEVDWIDGDTFKIDWFSGEGSDLQNLTITLMDLDFVHNGNPVDIMGVTPLPLTEFDWPKDVFFTANSITIVYPYLSDREAGDGSIPSFDVITAVPRCNGQEVTIIGTEANDKIIGTDGPDVIHGLGGFDIIWGMGGDDVICGGAGTDNISGREGNDIIIGGKSHDSIWGGPGNDILEGRDGNDSIFGGPGNDTVRGENGNDSLYGSSGTDRLYGGSGPDNNDTCYDTAGTLNQGCEVFYEE